MSSNQKPLTIDAYEVLKSRILHFYYRPGEVLMVQRIAKDLGISRTPVREALVRLSEEGLAGPTDGRKFQVTPLSIESITHLYEVREALESVAVRGAAKSRTEDDIRILKTILQESKNSLEKKDLDLFFEADWRFHDQIVHIHGNTVIDNVLKRMRGSIQRIRILTRYLERRVIHTLGEHEQIIAAIESGDPDRAESALMEHLNKVHTEFVDHLQAHDDILVNILLNTHRS